MRVCHNTRILVETTCQQDLVIGEVKLIVQTTGVLVTEKIVNGLFARHVLQISASGIDHHPD